MSKPKSKSTKTSKADFEIFKRECQRCVDMLGLKNWDIDYEHSKCEDGNAAECCTSYIGQQAVLRLGLERLSLPCTAQSIKETARHEVLELLLSSFGALNNSRFDVSEGEVDHVRHEIIQRLLNSPLFQ